MDNDTPNTGVDAPAVDNSQQVDTAETPSIEATVQVEQVAPEAAQSTGETSSEITATDTAEERLYAGKYKSVDDLERSYTELQSKATRDAQEKAELARILNETFTTPETPATAPVEDTASYAYEESDPVVQKLQVIERKDAVRDFVLAHPDADGQAVNQILQSDPVAASIPTYEGKLEYAYFKSQATAAPKVVAEAEKRASEQTQVKIAEKQAAQVEGARQQSQPAGEEPLSQSDLRESLKGDDAFDKLIQKQFPGISKMRART